ncbi:MATE family efflux transporter [Psychromonas sp. psych-6C06]|uniref:MATE family efflux transporter n=1 Tax=Psychromonas sp. psych-6C06 TaxID=2058089 RepID=UPI000C32CB18|nr:MATE family efflux transporter [Psychromonas sp. psych-6C06]PKF60384.1 MATE family efflux transporter [Psychromonas sp. psych-6C06]
MSYSQEITKILKLSMPLFIAQFAQTAMGFVDTIMAGGVSANDMAAVSIAASIWLPCILFGVGVLMALIPLTAQAHGANDLQEIPKTGQQGLYLALLLSIPIILILYNAGTIVGYMSIEPALKTITTQYLYAVLPAVPAFLLFQALRNYIEGLSLTKPAMVIGFAGLILNIPLNWIFVYGQFGMPALGGVGCGIATTLVYWFMLFALAAYVAITRKLQQFPLFKHFQRPYLKQIFSISALGLPVAVAMFFEVTIFAGIAVLVAPLGALVVASHQIAMNFSSMVFMLPMSIGSAVSIRVGFNLGQKNTRGAKVSTYSGLAIGLGLSAITALLTVIFKYEIATLYTDNEAVIQLAITLLLFAALYQCVDAIQVVAAGALRGYKEMTAIFTRTFIAYWVVGLPLGYLLAMTDYLIPALGAKGFWIGITMGLTVAAVLLGQRLFVIQRKLNA